MNARASHVEIAAVRSAGLLPLGWIGIVRLGIVQMALGAIVVMATSTMNRVMVVELALPAMLPGALIALHYAMQVFRPRLGHGSDVGGRRTPWIAGGMVTLAVGGILAACATATMGTHLLPAIALAVVAFALIGLGVGAAGTSLLVLLAKRVDPARRAAAASVVWIMMIAGFALTAGVAGHALDPFTPARLVLVTTCVALSALALSLIAIWNVEGRAQVADANAAIASASAAMQPAAQRAPFRAALAQVWHEREARRFAVFIFVSMLAYGAQDLILDPFAGAVFGLTPGQSTQLSGIQHGGVLAGMVLVGIVGSGIAGRRFGSLRLWTIIGCLGSACALAALACSAFVGPAWPLRASVFALGVANGAYAIAAIGSMMALVGSGHRSREGVRMGLWGSAQAIAFGLGGFLGTAASDVARHALGSPVLAYASVFAVEAALFLGAAMLAARIGGAAAGVAPAQPACASPMGVLAR